LSKKRNIQ